MRLFHALAVDEKQPFAVWSCIRPLFFLVF